MSRRALVKLALPPVTCALLVFVVVSQIPSRYGARAEIELTSPATAFQTRHLLGVSQAPADLPVDDAIFDGVPLVMPLVERTVVERLGISQATVRRDVFLDAPPPGRVALAQGANLPISLTFVARARSAEEAANLANTAALSYVAVRRESLDRRLRAAVRSGGRGAPSRDEANALRAVEESNVTIEQPAVPDRPAKSPRTFRDVLVAALIGLLAVPTFRLVARRQTGGKSALRGAIARSAVPGGA